MVPEGPGHPTTANPGPGSPLSRRSLLTRVLPAVALAAPTALARTTDRRPLALVYRGPASSPGIPEATADLLSASPLHFRTVYCGPRERATLSRRTLAGAALYAQPGGGNDLGRAWQDVRRSAELIRDFVRRGGHYLGICMGGYLAGQEPGFDLLPGNSGGYVGSPGSTVHTRSDTTVTVRWRGRPERLYFQDGPYFWFRRRAPVKVLATYPNGLVAAAVARYGLGSVGVVGPHPEADRSWFTSAHVRDDGAVHPELGYDLVTTTYLT